MRLINTRTMKMEECVSGTEPRYAILSHTWGKEEVSFQQYSTPEARSMAGYRKIERSCALASRSMIHHVWIDTCFIDKSSSAELSEAINSMYRRYRDAEVCYVYLPDMKRCEEWFTRGWTLQELLAPDKIEFYDKDWILIGTKKTMWSLLSKITGIKPRHLWMSQEASVAQKMSWAANRQTTRTEDLAYSLLGLFNVNMPLLYGEGEKAFKRLQYEILQSTNDESIFAWTDDEAWTSGLLAKSPANFAESGDFVPTDEFYRKPYTMTNQGLQIELQNSIYGRDEAGRFETPLRCAKESTRGEELLSLHMTYYTDGRGALRALRTGPFEVGMMENRLLRGTEKSDSFHIDDFRRPKMSPHWETTLYSNPFTEVSYFDSLTLRVRGVSLPAEDIQIFEDIGMTKVKGFSIVPRSEGPSALHSNHIIPMMNVYWSHDEDPAYLTLNIALNRSMLDSTQELLDVNKHPSSNFMLQAGNSLATWFGGNNMLFIAFSRQRAAKAYIDLELYSSHSRTEGFLQLTKADPLRAHKDYPKINLAPAFYQFELPPENSSGLEMYGKEISGLGRNNLFGLKSPFLKEM